MASLLSTVIPLATEQSQFSDLRLEVRATQVREGSRDGVPSFVAHVGCANQPCRYWCCAAAMSVLGPYPSGPQPRVGCVLPSQAMLASLGDSTRDDRGVSRRAFGETENVLYSRRWFISPIEHNQQGPIQPVSVPCHARDTIDTSLLQYFDDNSSCSCELSGLMTRVESVSVAGVPFDSGWL